MQIDNLELELVEVFPEFASPKVTVAGRTEMRAAERECADVLAKLLWIESDFIANIFNKELDKSYKEIFDNFNAMFYNSAKKLKYNYIKVDPFYFFAKYQPKI